MAYFPIVATTLPGGSPAAACGSPLSACFANGSFTVAGNHLATFAVAEEFIAYDDALPSSLIYPYEYDGSPKLLRFIVQESTFDGSNTIIVPTTPIEAIADTYVQIVDSPYVVEHSDDNKTPIIIPALESDSSTSLILPARAVLDFGQIIDTNFLQLLENFAGPTPPAGLGSPQQDAPVEGQTWYDTSGSPPQNILRVWNETAQEWETFQGAGIFDEFILGSAAAGSPATTFTPTNVTVRPRLGGKAFQQVFLNGVLQREDTVGFPANGSYYVTGVGGDIIFAFGLVSDDEILIYEL